MNELEQLQAQAKAINGRIAALQGKVPVRNNELGYYAVKACKDNLANIKLVANSIDLDKNSEIEITSAFNQINKASWTAIKSIERDAAERDA